MKMESDWKFKQIPDSIELEIPIQPKTKVIQKELQEKSEKKPSKKLGSQTFINCDLRFFNLKYLVEQIGHFEVVHIDPPWRIKGA
jgi:hypothetical protein